METIANRVYRKRSLPRRGYKLAEIGHSVIIYILDTYNVSE